MAFSECIFSQCRSNHVITPEGTPIFLQPVFKRSSGLPNVHLWEFCTGNGVDYSVSLIQWQSVLGVNQELAKGHQRARYHLDVQCCEDLSDCFREIADVRQGRVALGPHS